MTVPMAKSQDYLSGLVHELRKLPAETEWDVASPSSSL